jgi:hypothetical protein
MSDSAKIKSRIGMRVMADNLKFERDVLGKPYNPKEFSP